MRILKGTILLVFVCVFIRIAVGKPCVKVCRNTRCAFFFSLTIKIGSFF